MSDNIMPNSTENTMASNKEDPNKLLNQWHRGIRILHIAHAKAAARFEKRGKYLGLPVVVLTAIVGTGIFATLEEQPEANLQIIAGLLTALATILSAIQTFLNYPVLAEKHRQAEVEIGALRRDFERKKDALDNNQGDREQVLQEISERWNQIESKAPIPPNDLYQKALETSFKKANS